MAIQIKWEIEVTESYRATIEDSDLPDEVILFLENGWDIADLSTNVYPDGAPYTREQFDSAVEAIEDLAVNHEEGPYNDQVTDRDVTSVSMVGGS